MTKRLMRKETKSARQDSVRKYALASCTSSFLDRSMARVLTKEEWRKMLWGMMMAPTMPTACSSSSRPQPGQ